jgi:hypothetical protein
MAQLVRGERSTEGARESFPLEKINGPLTFEMVSPINKMAERVEELLRGNSCFRVSWGYSPATVYLHLARGSILIGGFSKYHACETYDIFKNKFIKYNHDELLDYLCKLVLLPDPKNCEVVVFHGTVWNLCDEYAFVHMNGRFQLVLPGAEISVNGKKIRYTRGDLKWYMGQADNQN